jgi:peptidoglycan/LPS O-acetylase OafA/YrhL
MMPKQRAFLTLDGLRGVAAIAVISAHTTALLGFATARPYLAVDFFFMLSGFVLTYAFQQQLDDGLTTFSFLEMRIARLYPLYLLGFVLGALFLIMQERASSHHLDAMTDLALVALGLLILPTPVDLRGRTDAFPFNVPSWSLFFEIVANIVHALVFRRRSTRFMAAVTAVSGACFLYFAHRLGTVAIGVQHRELLAGFARVLFSYSLGTLLFRAWKTGKMRVSVSPIVCALLLLAALLVPVPERFRPMTELLIVFFYFPALLFISAQAQPSVWLGKVFRNIGIASYAIYMLHVPAAMYFEHVWNIVRPHRLAHDAPWPGLLFIALVVAVAPLVDRFYDQPARKFLQNYWVTLRIRSKRAA